MNAKDRQVVDLLLDEVEKLLPYNDIYYAMAGGNIVAPAKDIDTARVQEIEDLALMLWNIHENSGETDIDSFLNKIFLTEPFCDYKEILFDKIKNIKMQEK